MCRQLRMQVHCVRLQAPSQAKLATGVARSRRAVICSLPQHCSSTNGRLLWACSKRLPTGWACLPGESCHAYVRPCHAYMDAEHKLPAGRCRLTLGTCEGPTQHSCRDRYRPASLAARLWVSLLGYCSGWLGLCRCRSEWSVWRGAMCVGNWLLSNAPVAQPAWHLLGTKLLCRMRPGPLSCVRSAALSALGPCGKRAQPASRPCADAACE